MHIDIKKDYWKILGVISYSILVVTILHKIYSGVTPFWYDPARDLLSAWDNLSHPTLIGPTSGIPGIFYGPYWIWLLSFGLLFSKDPRVVVFVTCFIPYLILFPLVLNRFSGFISRRALFVMGLLFLLNFQKYTFSLWNPYPAPFITLLIISLLVFQKWEFSRYAFIQSVFTGFLVGLLINFHISFGIGFFFGLFIFLLIQLVIHRNIWKNLLLHVVFWICGLLIAFSPFLLFELRHQFNQTKTALNALTHYGNVVALKGLSRIDILGEFFGRAGRLFSHEGNPAAVVGVLLVALTIILVIKYRAALTEIERRLLTLLSCLMTGILFIYLTARNPIWEYHFTGVEILFLLLFAVVITRFNKLFFPVLVIALVILAGQTFAYLGHYINPVTYTASVAGEEHNTRFIIRHAHSSNYSVFAYNQSIYSYDYAYLFRWLAHKPVPYRPELVSFDVPTVFVIIPPHINNDVVKDVLSYRTPIAEWKTTRQWKMPDGTQVIERTRVKK